MILYLFLALLHPIYISTSNVLLQAEGQWTATIKVFYDDLEDALQNQGGKRPNLVADSLAHYNTDIQIYLLAHLQFIQGASLEYRVVSASRTGDVVTILIDGIDGWQQQKNMTIINTLLLDLFESQKNIMTIRRDGDSDYFYMRKGLTSKSLDFAK